MTEDIKVNVGSHYSIILKRVKGTHKTPSDYIISAIKEKIIRDSEPLNKHITAAQIRDIVIEEFGVTLDQFKSKRRYREIVSARKCYCYMACKYTPLSLKEIGRLVWEGYNHATVIHSREEFDYIMLSDHKYLDSIREAGVRVIGKIEDHLKTDYEKHIDSISVTIEQ